MGSMFGMTIGLRYSRCRALRMILQCRACKRMDTCGVSGGERWKVNHG